MEITQQCMRARHSVAVASRRAIEGAETTARDRLMALRIGDVASLATVRQMAFGYMVAAGLYGKDSTLEDRGSIDAVVQVSLLVPSATVALILPAMRFLRRIFAAFATRCVMHCLLVAARRRQPGWIQRLLSRVGRGCVCRRHLAVSWLYRSLVERPLFTSVLPSRFDVHTARPKSKTLLRPLTPSFQSQLLTLVEAERADLLLMTNDMRQSSRRLAWSATRLQRRGDLVGYLESVQNSEAAARDTITCKEQESQWGALGEMFTKELQRFSQRLRWLSRGPNKDARMAMKVSSTLVDALQGNIMRGAGALIVSHRRPPSHSAPHLRAQRRPPEDQYYFAFARYLSLLNWLKDRGSADANPLATVTAFDITAQHQYIIDCNKLATTCVRGGDNREALVYCHQAARAEAEQHVWTHRGRDVASPTTFINLAVVSTNLKEFSAAVEYARIAIALLHEEVATDTHCLQSRAPNPRVLRLITRDRLTECIGMAYWNLYHAMAGASGASTTTAHSAEVTDRVRGTPPSTPLSIAATSSYPSEVTDRVRAMAGKLSVRHVVV